MMRSFLRRFLRDFLHGFSFARGLPEHVERYLTHVVADLPVHLPSGDLGKLARAHLHELKARMIEGDVRAREEVSQTVSDFLVQW